MSYSINCIRTEIKVMKVNKYNLEDLTNVNYGDPFISTVLALIML